MYQTMTLPPAMQPCIESNYMDAVPVGFHLSQDDVHLETRHDRQENPTGTGVAYVQFSNPDTAEDARNSKHKQTMGTRYIECMTLNSGMLASSPALLHSQSSHQDALLCSNAAILQCNTAMLAWLLLLAQHMLDLSHMHITLYALSIQQGSSAEQVNSSHNSFEMLKLPLLVC